jgi:DNA-binding CsgD family transcriptional regulator
LTTADTEKEHVDHTIGDDGIIDALTTFAGVLSTVWALVFTIVNLLLIPEPGHPGFYGVDSPTATVNSLDSILFFAAIVTVLATATALNDFLTTRIGKHLITYAPLVLGLLGTLLYFAGAPGPLCLALTAMSVCLFVLIWGAILSTLNSRVLTFMLMSTSVLTGIAVLTTAQLGTAGTFAFLALLYLVSWLSMRRVSQVSLDRITSADRRQSIERHVRGKGNSFTLMLVGGMFGIIAVLAWSIDLAPGEAMLALGACLLLAGLIIAFFYRNLPTGLGDVMKRTLALAMAVGLAPFPFLGRTGQVTGICFLLVVGIVNLVLIIDSILETSRFNQISPFWIIGLESGIFFAGVLAVLVCNATLIALDAQSLKIMAFTLVGAGAILQIYINNQAYPLFGVPAAAADEPLKDKAADKEEGEAGGTVRGSAFWRGRIDRIAAEYRLSDRQKEIMELLIRGRDLSYITAHFHISRSTAKTHVSNLYRKMNVHSKQELIDLMEPLQDERVSG